MKKYVLSTFILLIIAFISSSFYEKNKNLYHSPLRSGGAAAVGGAGRTGAPFDAGTCSNCHGGGIFAPTFDVELLNISNVPVTTYTPGASYTLRITITPTNGSPSYGFQTTCVQASTNNNLNTWETAALPFYAANVLLASTGRNYVEHIATLGNNVMNIPWTAPAMGYGAVSFYSIGNAVDGTGGTGGDNPTATSVLTITEGVLPVTLTSFKGEETKNGNQLYWETAQEINNDFFLIEYSSNGRDFTTIGKVAGNGNSTSTHAYSFKHEGVSGGKNYYRLAQTDYDGRVKYSQIITIENKANSYFISVSPNPVIDKIKLKGTAGLIGNKYFIVNNVGATVMSGTIQADNINVEQLPKGSYFIRIQQKDNTVLTGQFVK